MIIPVERTDGDTRIFLNMDEFTEYLAKCYNLDTSKAMLKINENTHEPSDFTFPSDLNDFDNLIKDYLNKFGIKYRYGRSYNNSIYNLYKSTYDKETGEQSFGSTDKFILSIIKPVDQEHGIITTSKMETITNIKGFTDYLMDVYDLDVVKTIKKINK